ncbi:UNVERIFIED_CONTAM: Stabilin-2 [Siphonaria sp. JEL0065]|nr:Stabilin-2 [Siphonaria sp. JEL0065]
MSNLLTASKSNTYMIGLYPNLTIAAADNKPASKFTLLAFTNAASDALATQNSPASALLTTPSNQAALLTYHIIPNLVIDFSASNPIPPFVPTALSRYGNGFDNLGFGENQNIAIKVNNGTGVFTTGFPNFKGTVLKSIKTDFGIIHVIDQVMTIPADLVSIYTTLSLTDYGSWMKAVNLTNTIKGIQGTTILIPAQGGIPRFLTANNIASGSDINSALKQAIIQYHIIPGIYFSNQIASSIAGDLPKNTAQQTYFNGQSIFAQDSSHFSTNKDGSGAKLTIQTPDIIFDSGVIHIVDTVLLPPTVSNAQTTPVVSPISQIYPVGMDPNAPPPLGSDIPVGAIVGGVAAALAVAAIGAGLFVVIRRRRLIAQLEHEKYLRQLELNEHFNNGAGGDDHGEKRVYVDTVSPAAAAAAKHQVPLRAVDEDEEEGDEEDEEEEEGEEVLQASYDQIMQYRRAQWASEDPQKRKSVVSADGSATAETKAEKRNSVVIDANTQKQQKRVSIAGGVDKAAKRVSMNVSTEFEKASASRRSSTAGSPTTVGSFNPNKRQSTASMNGWGDSVINVVINDPKEAKKEVVRNSWWSATGVGAHTQDAAVLEAQAIREEQRKSWWSGSGEVQEALHTIEANRRSSFVSPLSDKRKSTGSSIGEHRRRSNGGLSVYSQALESGGAGEPVELEYVAPVKSGDTRRSLPDKRKSWKPTKTSGLADGSTVTDDGVVVAGKKKQKRKSAGSSTEYATALASGENSPKPASAKPEEDSALAFVVGSN